MVTSTVSTFISVMTRSGLVLGLTLGLMNGVANAAMPSDPVHDLEFSRLPDGRDLRDVRVSGSRLAFARGTGKSFGTSAQTAYQKLKTDSKTQSHHPVQWVLMDLGNHQVIDQSASAGDKQFGASVSKIFVAGALLDKQAGNLKASQLQLMANMLVVSSNSAWTELQKQLGDGNSDRGRQANLAFTTRMGYLRTRGFQGFLGDMHGNELTAEELVEYLYDTYQGAYPGAETVWKIMHMHRTGASRARKYLPKSIIVGGKTGTYDGATVDPETGSTHAPNGSKFKVRVRHHVVVFNVGGREYGLAILANTGSDESTALLAGGLLREYTGYQDK